MIVSPYVKQLRERVGHARLMLPGVTAVIRDGNLVLLGRQTDTEQWSLIGGGIELGEEPRDALMREVLEEIGCSPIGVQLLGAYGGRDLFATYPNGDKVAYVTIAYLCQLPDGALTLDLQELLEVQWFPVTEISTLSRHTWIDRVIADSME